MEQAADAGASERGASGTGRRIRERRLARGLKQAELARLCGVSPSYLNLIEHGRRRIGGALLTRIARAVDAQPSALTRGAEPALVAALREAAQAGGAPAGAASAEALAQSHPDWAALVLSQSHGLRALAAELDARREPLEHDPQMASALHEVLSAATAIRSAASILTEPGEIDEPSARRFLRNIGEDALRLSGGAEALVGALSAGGERGTASPQGTPRDEVEAWIAARPSPAARLAAAELPERADARALALGWLGRMRDDLSALPEAALEAARVEAGADLSRAAHALGVPLSLVLRRIGLSGAPGVGLVICDATGTPTLRLAPEGFAVPRLGAPCPLWPLYDALTAPGRPVRAVVESPGPGSRRHLAWAAAEATRPDGVSGPVLVEAAMLILPADGAEPARPIGPGCRICPREGCPARREPSAVAPGL